MSTPALVGMALLNLVAAFGFFRAGNYGMTVVFTSYATACIGFIFGAK
jgi:hypothetical protein